jgi:cyclophilin family peptidyl-prolyl cis-trans isomerase
MKNIIQKTLAVSLIFPAIFLSACQPKPASTTVDSSATPINNTVSTPVTTSSMQTEAPKKGDMVATIETDQGTIKLRLFPDQAPETVKNFTELAKSGKYDNVPFHRVIEGFMIQTGDFTNKNGTGGYSYKGPGTKIDDEFSPDLTNIKGAVSMANAGPNTNGSQFFIVTADGGVAYLNNHYSVFGQVYEGQDVADSISKVKTGPSDNPLTPVMMKKVTISTL